MSQATKQSTAGVFPSEKLFEQGILKLERLWQEETEAH